MKWKTLKQKKDEELARSTEILYLWWKRKIALPISKIDDHVKHIFREHNQEAEYWANLGAEGQGKIIIGNGNNTERRKAVRGFWDGSSKINGKSGCGVVVKGADRNKWITFSKVSVLFGLWYLPKWRVFVSSRHPGPCLS